MLARGLQALLVTGQRPGEVFGMKWEHISEDSAWWDMPRSFTKNGNPHRVPLTKTAQDILKAAKSPAQSFGRDADARDKRRWRERRIRR